jgi:AAA15 family ATPase/GTPase
MIHYIKITNFGPIRDEVELSFEAALSEEISDDIYVSVMPDGVKLLKLAYIYGANASGKTTVLDVFEFVRKLLLRPLLDKSELLDFEPFLFCKDPLKAESTIELAFYANQLRHIYTVSFNREAVITERLVYFQSAKPAELFSRETDLDKRLAKIQFGSKVRVPAREKDRLESNTLHNNTVFGAFAKTNVDIQELNVLNLWFSMFLLGMISSSTDITDTTAELISSNEKINTWINKFMNKADRQISGVHAEKEKSLGMMVKEDNTIYLNNFLQGSFKIITHINPQTHLDIKPKFYGGGSGFELKRKVEFTHQTDEGSFTLPLKAESKGTQRYFSLGGPLYTLVHTNSFLLIDELENSLHPDLMKHFLQTFLANAGQSQLLITTHNVDLMEEIDFIRKDALWFSEKKEDGSVDLYSAADFDSSVLRKGASLVNAYRAGRLGAKPNLGSPFIEQE